MIAINNGQDNRLLLKTPSDIRALLNKLQRRRSRITGHYDNSNNIFSTAILHVSDNLIILDDTCDIAIAERILTSNKLMFSTICSGAPVSFVSAHIERCVYEGLSAFAVTIPSTVHWIQRRQYTRIREATDSEAACTITYDNGQISRNTLSDISVGGIAMLARPSAPPFKAGTLINNCEIELPNFGKLNLQIRICSAASITLENGNFATRYGCQFLDLPEEKRSELISYLSVKEAEQRAARATA